MGIAKRFEAALPLRGFFPSPKDLDLAEHWLATEERRHAILVQRVRLAEMAHGAEGAAPHVEALADSTAAVAWLKDRVAEWNGQPVSRPAASAEPPMTFMRFLTSPSAWITGGAKRRFEDR